MIRHLDQARQRTQMAWSVGVVKHAARADGGRLRKQGLTTVVSCTAVYFRFA